MNAVIKTLLLPKTILSLLIIASVIGLASTQVLTNNSNEPLQQVVQPPAGYKGAKVSFSFDDGYKSFITEAAPVLNSYGFSGTAYLASGYIDSKNNEFISWDEARKLQDDYKWEIGGHSISHQKMSEMDQGKLFEEVQNDKASLEQNGLKPQTFATPFGDYDQEAIGEIAAGFTGHRTFHDVGQNTWPYNNYMLQVQQVQIGVSVDTVKGYIDEAEKNGTWLILVFHNIADARSTLRMVTNMPRKTR